MTTKVKPTGGWQLFVKKAAKPPSVSVYKTGHFAVSFAACQILNAEYVVLLYDEKQGLVGLRAVSSDSPNAYRLVSRSRQNGKVVNASAFVRFYKLHHMKGNNYRAEIVDGILVFGGKRSKNRRRR